MARMPESVRTRRYVSLRKTDWPGSGSGLRAPGRPGRLGALRCGVLKRLLLVDTGAVYSVLPHKSAEPPSGPAISSASGQPIECWGWRTVAVNFGGRFFRWRFLLAAVAFPLLGADFLQRFALTVDLHSFCVRPAAGKPIKMEEPPAGCAFALLGVRPAAAAALSAAQQVVHQAAAAKPAHTAVSPSPLPRNSRQAAAAAKPAHKAMPPTVVHQVTAAKPAHTATSPSPLSMGVALQHWLYGCSTSSALQHRLSVRSTPSALPQQETEAAAPLPAPAAAAGRYTELLKEFPAVLCQSKKLPPVIHSVQHHIETKGRPVAAKYRRLDPANLAAAKKEFADMEKQEIICRSSSCWSSPLHTVKKPDGSWQPCGDFRRLNLQTKPDRYTCPNIGDLTARLAGCRVFSKLDLRKGYHQVPVRPEDICNTAIVTPFGTFVFLRMPFGLRKAGQTFQRFMDSVLADLPFCFVYIDDVLVASPTHEQHLMDLHVVLEWLQQQGLVLNVENCLFGATELDYLGHRVSATGIRPLTGRVEALAKYPQPKTVAQLQTFLGMVNFYRRFIAGAARILRPLT
jgi:Reverse transcriptase (RNA-dependent DNA polymerase)